MEHERENHMDMSRRDWYAGLALQAIIRSEDSISEQDAAERAWNFASAMMTERSERLKIRDWGEL